MSYRPQFGRAYGPRKAAFERPVDLRALVFCILPSDSLLMQEKVPTFYPFFVRSLTGTTSFGHGATSRRP